MDKPLCKDGASILKGNTEIRATWEKHFDDLLNHKAAIDRSVLDMIPNGRNSE